MKVLLLKSVPKVGKKDEVVEVAEGYAQHALFPKKWAIPASAAAVAERDKRHQNMEAQKEIRHKLLDTAIEELKGKALTIQVKANEQGNLFSKVHPADIVKFLLENHRISIDEAHLVVPEIKKRGMYTIGVKDEGYRSEFILTFK